MSQETLPSTCIGIRIDEPADGGVIVTALQVVEASIRVIPVSPVAEGVICSHMGDVLGDGCAVGVIDASGIAPGVIRVGGN